MTDFMKSRGMEEDMAEDRCLWCLGVDGRLLAVYVLIKLPTLRGIEPEAVTIHPCHKR